MILQRVGYPSFDRFVAPFQFRLEEQTVVGWGVFATKAARFRLAGVTQRENIVPLCRLIAGPLS